MSLLESSGRAGTVTSRFFWRYLFLSLRPKQWTKNAFVFAAILFSRHLLELHPLVRTIQVFIIFCLLSGSTYLVNDLVDRERDRLHPRKKYRPIAAGLLPPLPAAVAAGITLAGSLSWAFALSWQVGLVSLAYALQTVAYSFYLKDMVIIDVFVVALGFVLRVVAGAAAIMVPVSAWLLIAVILLALFLALCKRRHELVSLDNATAHRGILSEYSVNLLDQMIATVTSATVVVYAIYTFIGAPRPYLMYTVPLVLFGICRYLYLTYRCQGGGEPESLVLKDKPLAATILLWAASCFVILYWL
ncbi:decaprenyl-phosphate phosphoribosyltransferase [Neomoorella thermoacetica]|uniref:Decaprenyl-phosphate phosphoribosyltransferase n=1 Tax=Neomoorella thermoacetica TaxID=1525 RepID=A0AAC9MVY9_NEOTH|nr:decaprenyl-phosphate phosphoribosyltransferase [Moorella thermoacetica]AOQ24962.1 Decaprenyl-phosphate phosphoribosyltransferase [Moorella thermoacetica]APC09252.1 decaprenyl-phosphate phosphoribosyltransferase [Moorella thermoacetica]OIQ54712.1 decaprenyl-phosphate phosphoribosyltransferase [Moorella thermoacetica]TYL15496.1 Decaprenyl-phosphate phosphoribosyltransferase [Moorella thermoacetica]